MRVVILVMIAIRLLTVPVYASEYTAPAVPESESDLMPNTESFGEGLYEMVQKAFMRIVPDCTNALKIGISVVATIIIITLIQFACKGNEAICEMAGVAAVSLQIITNTNSMIGLGFETVKNILSGSTEKANIWEVNTEKEYHEEGK